MTVYLPNVQSERCDFFQYIDKSCDTDRKVVIIEHFNCVLTAHDETSSAPYRNLSTVALSSTADRYSLKYGAE